MAMLVADRAPRASRGFETAVEVVGFPPKPDYRRDLFDPQTDAFLFFSFEADAEVCCPASRSQNVLRNWPASP
jgi:hypothetical protein